MEPAGSRSREEGGGLLSLFPAGAIKRGPKKFLPRGEREGPLRSAFKETLAQLGVHERLRMTCGKPKGTTPQPRKASGSISC